MINDCKTGGGRGRRIGGGGGGGGGDGGGVDHIRTHTLSVLYQCVLKESIRHTCYSIACRYIGIAYKQTKLNG